MFVVAILSSNIQTMEFAELLQLLLPAWLFCGLLVGIGGVSLAIHSRKPRWSVRILAAALASSPALLAEAAEIFWLGFTSIVFALLLLAASDRFLFRKRNVAGADEGARLSIWDLLIVTTIVGISAAAGAITPASTPRAWLSLATIALLGSVLTCCIYFLSTSTMRLWFGIPIACTVAFLATLPVLAWDDLYLSLVWELDWPVYRDTFSILITDERTRAMWLAIIACSGLTLWLWWSIRGASTKLMSYAVGFVALLPVAVAFCFLIWPHPNLKRPKGPDAFEEAEPILAKISTSEFQIQDANYVGVDRIPKDVLDDCLQQIKFELDTLVALSHRPMYAPLGDGTVDGLFSMDLGAFRAAVRAMSARAERRLERGEQAAAIADYVAIFDLAEGLQNGGVWLHYLVATASRGIVAHSIHRHRDLLDETARKSLAKRLASKLETFENFNQRERLWILGQGWHPRLSLLLAELSGDSMYAGSKNTTQAAYVREQAVFRLLAIELAIDAAVARDEIPQELTDLDWLDPESLIDPYAAPEQQFRFRIEDGRPFVYSVGPDGMDDGGTKFWDGTLYQSDGLDLNIANYFTEPAGGY